MLIPKNQPLRDPAYLKAVRDMPCVICMATPCDPAHFRTGLGGGTGLKPPDDRVLPLCHYHHDIQHRLGERTFWLERMNWWLLADALIALAEKRYREWKK